MKRKTVYSIKFQKYLDDLDIHYCIVGNTSKYSENNNSDLDIVIYSDRLKNINNLIIEFSKKYQFKTVQKLQHEQNAFYFVLAGIDNRDEYYFMKLDVCGDYIRNGRLFLPAEKILKSRKKAVDDQGNGLDFYVPDDSVNFIYYLLKRIDKEDLSKTQTKFLSRQYHLDPEGCSREIKRYFPTYSDVLIKASKTNNWTFVKKNLTELKGDIGHHARRTIPLLIGEIRRIIQRIVKPTGLFVAFLGPDGSGKSSVAKLVGNQMIPAFRRKETYHLRPHVFRFHKRLEEKPVKDPHNQSPRNKVVSFIKLICWVVDYLIGYVIEIYPRLVCSTLVLFDRYYHDLLVDPRRYRYGGTRQFVKLVGKLIPQPDYWILLDAPVEVIQDRKSEVSRAELKRQRQAYKNLFESFPEGKYSMIDASQPLKDVVHDVEGVLLDHLERRTKERMGESSHGEY